MTIENVLKLFIENGAKNIRNIFGNIRLDLNFYYYIFVLCFDDIKLETIKVKIMALPDFFGEQEILLVHVPLKLPIVLM